MFALIDFLLRLVLMGFFTILLVQAIIQYHKAKMKDEPQAKTFHLAYILFYLLNLANYIQAEIDLQYQAFSGNSIYPNFGLISIFGNVSSQTIIFIIFLIPSILPIMYIIEKRMLNFNKPILTSLGIFLIILTGISLIVKIAAYYLIIIVGIGLLILIIGFMSFYVKLAYISDGVVKEFALLSLFGWILIILGTIILGVILGIVYPHIDLSFLGTITHSISIVGVFLIFLGSLKIWK
ncbi:MAG: hypothetical protein ACP6IY_16055 [Promethearchaeia archaeon]